MSGRENWGFVDVDSDSAEEKDGSGSEERETRLVASTPYCDNPAFDWLIRFMAGEVSYDNAPKRIVAEARNANLTLTRLRMMIQIGSTNPSCINANPSYGSDAVRMRMTASSIAKKLERDTRID